MGGDRTNRLHRSIEDLDSLVEEYIRNGNKLYSPVTKKIYKTYTSWLFSFTYNIDKEGCNYFFYKLEPTHYSKHSGAPLNIESFSYSDTYRNWKGWKSYTPEEIKNHAWMNHRNYTASQETKDKIKNTLLQYNISDEGINDRAIKSKNMKNYWTTVDGVVDKNRRKVKQSNTMKELICKGEFTPPITNSWTHWNACVTVNGKMYKFRSSWEACFWFCNQQCLYETIRVKTPKKTYVNDFFDPIKNTCYEIKPRNRYNTEIEKMSALLQYCMDHNIKFIWINENNIIDYIDESLFTDKFNNKQLEKVRKIWKH